MTRKEKKGKERKGKERNPIGEVPSVRCFALYKVSF